MYEVQKVVGGYQVWQVEEHRPVDDQYLYNSRQNAYVRRDQLNEQPRGKVFIIAISLDRKDCYEGIQLLKKTFGSQGIEFIIIDPLNDLAPEVREVTFKYRCALPDPEVQPVLLKHSRRHPPLSEEGLAEKLEHMAGILPESFFSLTISPALCLEDREIERIARPIW